MRISFDFDSTLSEERIQRFAKAMSTLDVEMWIISSRVDENRWGWNKELFRIANQLNISRNRIILTEGDVKWKPIKEHGIDIHFDDDQIEVELIEENTTCNPVLICDPDISHIL